MQANILTKQQAQAIVDAHEIEATMNNEEEIEILMEHNPDLHDAYKAVCRIAGVRLEV